MSPEWARLRPTCVFAAQRPLASKALELAPLTPTRCRLQASLATCSTSGLPCWLQLSLDGQSLVVHRSSSRGQPGPPSLPGFRTIPPAREEGGDEGGGGGSAGGSSAGGGSAAGALASLARYLGVAPARLQLDSVRYRRVRTPSPADLQAAAGEPEGMALLRRCQVGGLHGTPGSLGCLGADRDVHRPLQPRPPTCCALLSPTPRAYTLAATGPTARRCCS